MAATATLTTNRFFLPGAGGGGGAKGDIFVVRFDADATVELGSTLCQLITWWASPIGSGGNANMLSLDETLQSDGRISAPTGKKYTLDAAGTSTDTFLVTLLGY